MTRPRSQNGLPARGALCLGALPLLAAGALGCDSPDVFVPLQAFGGPAGVIDGTVTYSGPRPCTRGGHVVGAAVILAFDTDLLPPPEGLGTSAASLAIVSGDRLFGGIRGELPDDPGGGLLCPDAGAPPVTVSLDWAIAPLPGGVYQIRGFYDLDGDFDPAFIISNLPTKGDVGGGAIDNAADVLQGAAPIYREITLGTPGPGGALQIPETGARVGGVAVTLGLPLPLERPVFHVAEVLDELGTNTDPAAVVMASDFQMNTFSAASPADTEKSFIRLRLAAGVPQGEAEAAAKSPFFFPVGPTDAPAITFARQDVNGDGVLDAADHVPDSTSVPSLYPLSIFSKLSSASDLVSASSPTVVLQGLTLYNNLVSTAMLLGGPTIAQPDLPEAIVALRPAALCLHAADPSRPGVLVVSRETDTMNNPLITDVASVEAALAAQFKREIKVQFGCLPEGRYAMNLIYSTGQAWTVPNEAGVCAPSEAPSAGKCGSRPRLESQGPVLTIGPPGDPQYCKDHPTPAICFPDP
ncbi:MAG: hypothetical protein IT372_32030 [Polyangiaceae bacterium]|nr:hypothetical protein [Polyangiaceae bacterium]